MYINEPYGTNLRSQKIITILPWNILTDKSVYHAPKKLRIQGSEQCLGITGLSVLSWNIAELTNVLSCLCWK